MAVLATGTGRALLLFNTLSVLAGLVCLAVFHQVPIGIGIGIATSSGTPLVVTGPFSVDVVVVAIIVSPAVTIAGTTVLILVFSVVVGVVPVNVLVVAG